MPRTITVKGTGRVQVRPDYVVLTMNLKASGKEYEKVMEMAEKQLEELKKSIEEAGYDKKDTKTTDFNVRTEYDSVMNDNGSYRREFKGFVCSHQLKLSFDFDMYSLMKALGAVSNCMAHPEFNIAFTVKDLNKVNEELLKAASENARKKAEVLCAASNVKLGNLLSIDYNWGELNIYSRTRYEMDNCIVSAKTMSSRSMDIEPDDIDVSDSAAFVWEIL